MRVKFPCASITLLLILLLLVLASLACVGGGGGGGQPGGYDATATYGAELFHAQLTAQSGGQP